MSAVMGSYSYEMDASYAADFSRDREQMTKRSRHPEYRRKGSAPTRVSGMHCRRNKRWTWGSGRGARMANLRAFAGCLAVAIAAMASDAFAVTFSWSTITAGSNAAYSGNGNFPSGVGSVSYGYRMSDYETTRAQYVDFLNAVATSTSAPGYVQALYTGTAGTVSGVTRTLVGGAYQYSSTTGSLPVGNLSWTAAARFVNWLNNGEVSTTNTATLDTVLNSGAYTLTTSNTGMAPVARSVSTTPGSTPKYWLPSADEWYKAAFYDPNNTTWNNYQTNVSGTVPPTAANGIASSGTNVANYRTSGSIVSQALPVGSFPNTKSPYGLYDMLGNVTEMTDTGNGTGWYSVSGNYNITAANIPGWSITNQGRIGSVVYLTQQSITNGFRVAGVAAVPEPETITLAAFGIVGLCGANWLKRRRKPAALPAPGDEALAA